MKWLLLAVGGYVLYEYFYGPATAAATAPVTTTTIPPVTLTSVANGGAATGGGGNTNVPVAPMSAQPLVSSTLQTQLQQLANAAGVGNGCNVDEWFYFYAQATGISVAPSQVESTIQALGLSDATRGTYISVTSFLQALTNIGLLNTGLNGLGLVSHIGYGGALTGLRLIN